METEYATTDFDLISKAPFDALNRELHATCRVRHYTHGADGQWYSTVQSAHSDESSSHDAATDILAMLHAVKDLSPTAKAELAVCDLREFNIGFHCWDSWGYVHTLPAAVVRAIADAECSIAVTLYPMRDPDGTPKV